MIFQNDFVGLPYMWGDFAGKSSHYRYIEAEFEGKFAACF